MMSSEPTAVKFDRIPVRRALISVSDKTGLLELAQALVDVGVSLVSTGNSAKSIAAAGIPVSTVESVTGFPEILEGRVKTLHPSIHAGILADQRKPDHVGQLADLGVQAFELVVVNLYPFSDTVASGAGPDEVIEQIDIGGPSMVRAAAKNHPSVAIVVDPASYPAAIAAVRAGGFTLAERKMLAINAFRHTASYDIHVSSWMGDAFDAHQGAEFADWIGAAYDRTSVLRYGENPHQGAALYAEQGAPSGLAQAVQLHGKEMSYNNYVDADAAWRAAHDHQGPAVAIIKHANPCGIAIGETVAQAHRRAHASDPISAFGGVIAVNAAVTADLAEQVAEVFTEVLLAPSFEPEALAILRRKKNIRLLQVPGTPRRGHEIKAISGGLLVQSVDVLDAAGDDPSNWTLATGAAASAQAMADLAFAWRACRSVKSNAILLARDGASVGVGMGQVNRVDSARLAVERAGDRAAGSVAASDAFFPFADGLQILLDAGVVAVVQPGGSVRDEEVIEAAKAAGITLYLTGARHFFH
ncbi:bifunctional phosphoribosylaminoimidazolecarboxamide formyltransferase/IMP cyclohydrolase PurH [Nakamurella antarctica]|uniref:Bifunctional purine biosynthesis protein PurH n=1 Tax=Nakamurella antarctica TaxID=1902245 RepID=A0A3G8ZMX9_9ACTN|nr:bifunctional phosphoribosylaminoimidazolecarboxamide formyltransferase/IMP cyclohydrolase [Nakamurella antarctica]AZI58610.1 bifunctional phosphoribosylaminoimidazolecarboxamide formyltransferase/IMP cyclohydrolase PurH [Nakamurella antarctica]